MTILKTAFGRSFLSVVGVNYIIEFTDALNACTTAICRNQENPVINRLTLKRVNVIQNNSPQVILR